MKDFVPYELAYELKQLGFDADDYFGFWNLFEYSGEWKLDSRIHGDSIDYIEAPLYQQAFRFFREKYKASPIITCYSELGNAWRYHIPNEGGEYDFYTYEEAELACLKKLIEIVKTI
jgi:hypothetical protein